MFNVLAYTFLGYTFGIFWFFIMAVIWVMLAVLPAAIARSKGHNFWGWFFLSIFFWWITLFVTLLMKDKTRPTAMPYA